MREKPPPQPLPQGERGSGPKPPSLGGKWVGGLGLWVLFLCFLGLWTWKLLEPSPVPERLAEEVPTDLKFIAAKLVHAGAYAFLTVLAATLPVRRPYFWLVLATLAVHAIGTEVGQTYVPNRHGSARDVLIDWVGIGLGLVALAWFGPNRKR